MKLSSRADADTDDLITICVPTYRRPSLLLHALTSCLAQDYRPLEIDISDDSPNDDSERCVASLPLPEGITLRYSRNRPALKQAANVNKLFDEARGKRLVLLHDDDALLPGAITALNAAWSMAPDIVAAYGIQTVLFESGEVSAPDTLNHNGHAKRLSAYCGVARDVLVRAFWRQFPNNGYLIDTLTARSVGYRSFEDVGDACDVDFSIRLAYSVRGKAFVFIDRLTSEYRMNLSGLNQAGNSSWKIFDWIDGLADLTPAEAAARDLLLQSVAAQATVENALHGRPLTAFKIFRSRSYTGRANLAKSAYHLSLMVAPQLHLLRKLSPAVRLA